MIGRGGVVDGTTWAQRLSAKGFLKVFLPMLRTLPLPVASRFVSGIGRMEYRLSHRIRGAVQEAVAHGRSVLDCQWDVSAVSRELAGNHVLWRTRDLLLDGVPDQRARQMFVVSGRENLDAAFGSDRGCIVLASHFGAHLLPAHWLFREKFPVRFYMERPRHISRFPGATFRDGRSARPGETLHFPPGHARRIRPARSSASLRPQRPACCFISPVTSDGPDSSPSRLDSWARRPGSQRPGSCWPR